MGKKGPLWWRESDWLLRGSSAANQILLRHSGPILSTHNNPTHFVDSHLAAAAGVNLAASFEVTFFSVSYLFSYFASSSHSVFRY